VDRDEQRAVDHGHVRRGRVGKRCRWLQHCREQRRAANGNAHRRRPDVHRRTGRRCRFVRLFDLTDDVQLR
jgi:hypothetical protein